MSLDEATLRSLFEKSQEANPEKMRFSAEESTRFKRSFEDPEFRKLFADYMDELQDPKNREETEAYISQLEGEQKVPEGKELIRPEPAFVAKSYKIQKKNAEDKEKIFLNIVQSTKINVPTSTTTPQGTCWSVPYSLGPPHMEKDKNGDNAPCFDCCFHPQAIQLGKQHKEFKDLLVTTAMEGVETLYQQQGQDITINREFHVVKGLEYKSGQVPTMMIATANKGNWDVRDEKKPAVGAGDASAAKKMASKLAAAAGGTQPEVPKPSAAAPAPPAVPATASSEKAKAPAGGPAIKKGFLNSSKSEIYGDKLTTIRAPNKRADGSTGNISLVDQSSGEEGDRAAAGLSIPTSSTAAKRGKGSGNSLIQEVKPGSQPAAGSAPASSAAGAHKPVTRSAGTTAGLTAVSTTKRVPPPTPAISTSQEALASPSGHRDITVTSPSGSDIADADAAFAASLSATENGLEVPKFTVKERGHISMGDFENVNTTARSNRPNELVYRIELPKITKASAIVLDIAERQLNLSYPELYSLVVKLPYPVFDAKGTAKYDKTSKSLTVTLPVRPPAAVPLAPSTPQKGDSAIAEGAVQELGEGADASSGSPVKATPAKKSSVGHNRWVEGSAGSAASAGSGESNEGEPPLSLHEEVKRQAEAALQAAKLAAANKPAQPASTPAAAAAPASTLNPTPATVPASPAASAAFIAATAFAGRKEGYYFKKDTLGLGYYADAKQGSPQAPVPPTPAPTTAPAVVPAKAPVAAASEAYVPFPFVARQTKPSVAVIVEVANIDPASVKVAFHTHAVHITFRAFVDMGAASEAKIGRALYGAVLHITEASCPGGFDVSKCRFDVAEKNMAIVLTKLLPAYWNAAGSDVAAAQGESKSGDADQSAMGLLQVLPYTEPSPTAVTSTPAPPAQKTDRGTATEAAQKAKSPEPAKSVRAEDAKAVKALEGVMQALQFSSSDALFELD